jgi:signal transduction histidine kinase
MEQAQGGLGLGLALVKSFVTMHGGSVQAWSQGSGNGSTFEVRLPALPHAPRRCPWTHS